MARCGGFEFLTGARQQCMAAALPWLAPHLK
jgi:hypothetical protein